MNWRLFIVGLVFVLSIGVVSANLVVSPTSATLTVQRGIAQNFNLTLWNNNSYPIYNLSFIPVAGFTFPNIPSMSPNQTLQTNYSVLANTIFSSGFSSTLMYFANLSCGSVPSNVLSPCNPVSVNISLSDASFTPVSLTIYAGDAVAWHSTASTNGQIIDNPLNASGFSSFSINSGATVVKTYASVANYSFYYAPTGYGNQTLNVSGSLFVVPRPSQVYFHDSGQDVGLHFVVNSVLPQQALQVNLIGNLTLNNNQSAVGYMQVINNDPQIVITGIHLSANQWVSNFSINDFNLNPSTASLLSSQLVSFSIQPIVSQTSQTNTTQLVNITMTTANAGTFTGTIPVFINYQNLDVLNINGTQYLVNFLNASAAIQFCMQYPTATDCLAMEQMCLAGGICHNNTVIQQVQAQYKFDESTVANLMSQMNTFGNVSQRLLNGYNLENDKVDSLVSAYQAAVGVINDINESQVAWQAKYDKKQQFQDQRFWAVVIAGILILIGLLVWWLVRNVKYFGRMEESLQLGGNV